MSDNPDFSNREVICAILKFHIDLNAQLKDLKNEMVTLKGLLHNVINNPEEKAKRIWNNEETVFFFFFFQNYKDIQKRYCHTFSFNFSFSLG